MRTSPPDLYTRITNILRLCQVRSLGWYDVDMLDVAQRSPGPVIVPSEIVVIAIQSRAVPYCVMLSIFLYTSAAGRRVKGLFES